MEKYIYDKKDVTDPQDQIPVYIEKFDRMNGYLVVDFSEQEILQKFIKRYDLQYANGDKRSMLEISNLNISNTSHLREGSHYLLPKELLEEGKWMPEPLINNDIRDASPIFAYRLNASQIPSITFGKAIRYTGYYKPNYTGVHISIPFLSQGISIDDKLKIIVRNVGQGNWNEIYIKDNKKIIYDFGASIRYTQTQLDGLIRKYKIDKILYDNSVPLMIISHWDIDHYMMLLSLSDSQIKSIGMILCMDKAISQTAKNVLSTLQKNLGTRLSIISASERESRRSSLKLHLVGSNKGILLFKGTQSSSINKSGLVLGLQTKEACAVLPADHHYSQIEKDVFPHLNKNLTYNMVVPHHCGNAGRISSTLTHFRKNGAAVISVGKNSYHHPFKIIKNQLSTAFSIQQTNISGDITIML